MRVVWSQEKGGLGQSDVAPHCQLHPNPTWAWLPRGRSGRVRWGIEDKEGGILKTLFLGPCAQPVMPLELDKPDGGQGPVGSALQGGDCWGWGSLFPPLARAALESRDQAGCHRRRAGNKGLFFRV